MRVVGCILWLALGLLIALPCYAVPITTKYYSLTLPEDWVVLRGPTRQGDSVLLQLADRARTVTATVMVGEIRAGEAETLRSRYARELRVPAHSHAGQTEFFLHHGRERGYVVLREDRAHHLLLILTVSGEVARAQFLFAMRSPYPALTPTPPLAGWSTP